MIKKLREQELIANIKRQFKKTSSPKQKVKEKKEVFTFYSDPKLIPLTQPINLKKN